MGKNILRLTFTADGSSNKVKGGMKMTPVQGPDREERLNRMVIAYEKDLLRLCCAYLRDVELARDAVQETFLKAYRRMDRFEGKASEKTWLMRIAINTCKDTLRSGWLRHVDAAVTLEDLPLPVAPPSVEHIALTSAIMALPRNQMEVILLNCQQGRTIRETAQVLGITPPAVINRLKKARAALYDALEGGTDE